MQRSALPAGFGMWFPFQPARHLQLWMYKTSIPLDMIFVHEGHVLAVKNRVAVCQSLPCPIYSLSQDIDGVIETRAGEVSRLRIRVGDPVAIGPSSLTSYSP